MPANPFTQPQYIHVGRGDIYIGVTVPATPPVPLVSGIPTTGRFIGSTLAPALLTYKPTLFPIETQQSTVEVAHVITKEEMTLEFEVGELVYENLRDFITGAKDGGSYITMGGVVVPPTFSILMVAGRRAASGSYIETMIYQSVFGTDRQYSFQRQGHTNPKVTAMAEGVLTRAVGDQLGFFHPNVIST